MKTLKIMLILLTLCVAASVSAAEVTKITLSCENGATVARIDVQGPFQFTHQTEVPKNGKPDRMILDVVGAVNELAGSFTGLPACQIKGIRTSQYAVTPEKVARIVFDLTKAPVYQVTSEANWIQITFDDKGVTPFASWNSGTPIQKPAAASAKPVEKPAAPMASTAVQVTKNSPDAAKVNQTIEQDRTSSLAATSKSTAPTEKKAPASAAVTSTPVKPSSETTAKTASPALAVTTPAKVSEKPVAQTSATESAKKTSVTMSTPIPQTTPEVKPAATSTTSASSIAKPTSPSVAPSGAMATEPATEQKPAESKTAASATTAKSAETVAQNNAKPATATPATAMSPNAVPPAVATQKTELKPATTTAAPTASKPSEPAKAAISTTAGPQNASPEVKWVSPTAQAKPSTETKTTAPVTSSVSTKPTEPAKVTTSPSATPPAAAPSTATVDQAAIAKLNAPAVKEPKPTEPGTTTKGTESTKPALTASPVVPASSPASKVSPEAAAPVKTTSTAVAPVQSTNNQSVPAAKPAATAENKPASQPVTTTAPAMPAVSTPLLPSVPKVSEKSPAAEPVTPAKTEESKTAESKKVDTEPAATEAAPKDQAAASSLPGPLSTNTQLAEADNQGTNQPEDAGRPTARFRRTPLSANKIKGTLVAEFPQRLVIKYEDLGNRDPFATLIDETRTNDHPNEQRIPNIEGLKLVGIIVSPAGDNRALFADKAGYSYMMQSGDKVQRGYVLRVESDKVYFQIFEYGWSRTVALTIENAD